MTSTVLVVEDEDDLLFTIALSLELNGYRVMKAASGEEALGIVEKERPDAVVLDLRLPGIDGWETLTRLKRDAATSTIPVVIFTAREHSRGHQKSTEMGAADYFRKPFEPDELIELVEKHVGQKV